MSRAGNREGPQTKSPFRSSFIAIAMGLCGAGVLLFWSLRPSEEPGAETVPEPAEVAAPAPPSVRPLAEAEGHDRPPSPRVRRPVRVDDRELGPLPSSLRGTNPPDVLEADENGELVLRSDIPDLFEYFLATVGEEDVDDIFVRVVRHIEENLPPEAAEEAKYIAEDYFRFRLEQRHRRSEMAGSEGWEQMGMRERLDNWASVRREYFDGEVADAFFGGREMQERYAVDRQMILEEEGLSEAQRQAALDQLRAELPEEYRESLDDMSRMSRLHHEVREIRESGGSEQAVHEARVAAVGEEMTAQLEELDRRRGILP